MKRRFARPGDELEDEDEVIVRGGRLDRDLLRADAARHHAVYGSYAVSVFALRRLSLDELAQQAPLVRFAQLTVTTVGAIRSAGLRLVPTGRNPNHYSVELGDLDQGVAALLACEHHLVDNPYHDG